MPLLYEMRKSKRVKRKSKKRNYSRKRYNKRGGAGVRAAAALAAKIATKAGVSSLASAASATSATSAASVASATKISDNKSRPKITIKAASDAAARAFLTHINPSIPENDPIISNPNKPWSLYDTLSHNSISGEKHETKFSTIASAQWYVDVVPLIYKVNAGKISSNLLLVKAELKNNEGDIIKYKKESTTTYQLLDNLDLSIDEIKNAYCEKWTRNVCDAKLTPKQIVKQMMVDYITSFFNTTTAETIVPPPVDIERSHAHYGIPLPSALGAVGVNLHSVVNVIYSISTGKWDGLHDILGIIQPIVLQIFDDIKNSDENGLDIVMLLASKISGLKESELTTTLESYPKIQDIKNKLSVFLKDSAPVIAEEFKKTQFVVPTEDFKSLIGEFVENVKRDLERSILLDVKRALEYSISIDTEHPEYDYSVNLLNVEKKLT
jgi:hypothetical protein